MQLHHAEVVAPSTVECVKECSVTGEHAQKCREIQYTERGMSFMSFNIKLISE
jgi:hypothetical protein